MGKSRRSKRHKSNVKNHGNGKTASNDVSIKTDEVRTNNSTLQLEEVRACASGEKFDKSCLSPLHIVDILSSIETPSPKGIDRRCERKSDNFLSPQGLRPRSNSSISRFSSLAENSFEEDTACKFLTPKSSVSRRGFDETTSTDRLLYKTPMTHLRHNLFKDLSPASDKVNNFTKSDNVKDNSNGQYFTPAVQKKLVIKGTICSSTPINTCVDAVPANVIKESATNTTNKSLVTNIISPIAKSPSVIVPYKKFPTLDFRKYKKFGIRWYPFGIIDGIWGWLRAATRKVSNKRILFFPPCS